VIRSAKGGPFGWLVKHYVARKVRRSFRGVWVRGPLPSAENGLIAYLNHSSFWDGFIAHQLGQQGGWDGYAMMEEENMAKYPFHARLGAFSIRRGDSRSALETMRYAKTLLRRPNSVVVIFPQGEIRSGVALGRFSRGVEVLARSAGVKSVAMAVRYAFFEHEFPDVLIDIGTPHEPADIERYEGELDAVHTRVNEAMSLEGFSALIRGRTSIQHRWDTARRLASGR
jgi:1-acyl-sn-glycerol-3-phosphate acyltransferase